MTLQAKLVRYRLFMVLQYNKLMVGIEPNKEIDAIPGGDIVTCSLFKSAVKQNLHT